MQPIIPFEPIVADVFPEGSQWIAQIKWDGVRILTYYDGQIVKLYNRKHNERTIQFPELSDIKRFCKCESVILDGEMIALDNGKPSFYEIMKRDGITKLENIPKAIKDTPVAYMIFDLIYLDGEWVNKKPLKERQELLKEIIIPQDNIQLVENFTEMENLFEVIKEQGMEGVVCKDLRSSYLINGKDARWRKVKNYRDIIAVVGGFTMRGSTVNALILGLYDPQGNLIYVGHTGTGQLTQKDWRSLTDILSPLIVAENPFKNKVVSSLKPHWLKPKITVKIKFSEWTPTLSLRQPSIQAFVNIAPEECLLPEG